MGTINRRQLLSASLGAATLYLAREKATMAISDTTAAPATGSSNVRLLGSPCEARNINSGLVIEDRGRSYMVLGNMNETSHMELIFVDTEAGTGEVYRAPAGAGSWALQPIPGNKIVVGTFYDGMFMVFDVTRREWVHTARLSQEEYLWSFAVGSDGRVYGGTYPNARLGALDPKTYAVEDLGRPSHENLYMRWVSPLPDGRIFCPTGFAKPATFVFDPATKQFTPAPAALQSAGQGVPWNGFFLVDQSAYRMPDLASVHPLPFPVPDAKDGAWTVDLRLTTPKVLVLRQGYKIWRYEAGDKELTLWTETPHKGVGAIYGVTNKGALVGVRGQDYFSILPGDKTVALHRIPGAASPRDTHFLYADANDRIWGGPTFGQTLFYMDLKTGKTVNTSGVSERGGEVYDVEVVDGVAFAVAYVGGEIIRFDPSAPWDQVDHVNPRRVASVGPEYIRPSAGVTLGPDGKLYSGWLAKYGTYGGALAITDPKTFHNEIIKDPMGPHGISGVAVVDPGHVLLGTTTYGNGLGDDKTYSAAFGVFDIAAGKTTFTHTFPGTKSVNGLVYDPAMGIAAISVDGALWLFDTKKAAFIGDGPATPDKISAALALRGSKLLYGQGSVLQARDLTYGETTTLATLPAKVDKIAVAPDAAASVYVACGAAVYAVL